MKLDYSIETPEARTAEVYKFLAENPDTKQSYYEILADYIITAAIKQEEKEARKKQKEIITDNRKVTINKRELSFENLAAQFENGEDGIYNFIANDKNIIFRPKIEITQKDLNDLPELRQIQDSIQYWRSILPRATGKEVFIIKQAIIDFQKDQYLAKDMLRGTIKLSAGSHGRSATCLDDTVRFLQPTGGEVDSQSFEYTGVTFLNPDVNRAILQNYISLVDNGIKYFDSDTKYLMWDFKNLLDSALRDYPIYKAIVNYKIIGFSNLEIKQKLQEEFGFSHSLQYISSLWNQKIPSLLTTEAENQYLDWYYLNVEKGTYKKCHKCGQIKLANSRFFSKNKTSKDGFYSICKECRKGKKV